MSSEQPRAVAAATPAGYETATAGAWTTYTGQPAAVAVADGATVTREDMQRAAAAGAMGAAGMEGGSTSAPACHSDLQPGLPAAQGQHVTAGGLEDALRGSEMEHGCGTAGGKALLGILSVAAICLCNQAESNGCTDSHSSAQSTCFILLKRVGGEQEQF